ncbi:MAG: T9SS type A sorting domain-containing protein, partial [Bacteroidales bacterium]|nr:T9SS type A sorting domain-containing protein [Bacteroidales bacterium]
LPTYSNSPDVLDEGDCPEVYQNEVLNPEISSITNFIFEDGPINGLAYAYHDACALSLDNLVYKSFFTSFDLSQFTNDDDINMIIQEALDWFGYIPVGIEPNPIPDEQFVTVYPNPGNGIFNIEISNKEMPNSSIQIFNSQGKIIFQNELSDYTETIDISKFDKGIYLLKVTSENKSIFKKLINVHP